MHLVVIDGVKILVGHLIGHQTIVVVFKDAFSCMVLFSSSRMAFIVTFSGTNSLHLFWYRA